MKIGLSYFLPSRMAEGLFCGLPRRYVFIGFDLFLLLVILLYAMMPSDSKLGPTAGYSTPDGRWVTETTAAANAVGPDPKPWQNPAAKWRRKRHLRKHLARYAVEQEEAMWNATWDGETRRGIKRRRLKRGRKGTLGGRGGEESDDGTAIGSSSAPEASSEACSSPPSVPCSAKGRALVTLSLAGTKKRDHFTVTRVPMEAYAQAVRHFRTQQEDQLLISRYPPCFPTYLFALTLSSLRFFPPSVHSLIHSLPRTQPSLYPLTISRSPHPVPPLLVNGRPNDRLPNPLIHLPI